jgi:hypothetical protein
MEENETVCYVNDLVSEHSVFFVVEGNSHETAKTM